MIDRVRRQITTRPMSTGRRVSWRWALGLVLPMLGGCPLFLTPHENFLDKLKGNIGYRMNPYRDSLEGWAHPRALLRTSRLPNGWIAYTYAYHATCLYTLDVDPKTHVVRAVRWAGYSGDCGIYPW